MNAPQAVGNHQGVLDFAAVTSRQQQTWATGDFNVIALSVLPASEQLVEAVNPHAGQCVLDVACGSGNAALRSDIAAVFERYNEATDGTCAMRCEYLQVVATRR